MEVDDFVAWAEYLQSLPYVKGDKIGVEGFSFGGTMTAVLVATAPQAFHYGIAGGGVYDWKLYDTHYTERFMSTPDDNPDGYARTRAVDRIASYPARPGDDGSVIPRRHARLPRLPGRPLPGRKQRLLAQVPERGVAGRHSGLDRESPKTVGHGIRVLRNATWRTPVAE